MVKGSYVEVIEEISEKVGWNWIKEDHFDY